MTASITAVDHKDLPSRYLWSQHNEPGGMRITPDGPIQTWHLTLDLKSTLQHFGIIGSMRKNIGCKTFRT